MTANPAGQLVVFAGPPCAGKSTLAAALSRRLGVAHLQMDQLRARLMPRLNHHRTAIDIAYFALHFGAQLILERGDSVIVDSTYGRPAQRQELETIAGITHAPLFLVQCKVSPGIALARFRRRALSHPATDLTATRVRLLAEKYPYAPIGLILEAATSIDRNLAAITDYLRREAPIEPGAWSTFALQSSGWPGPEGSDQDQAAR